MTLRKVVNIDEDLCTGCGDCVPSCAEGAIQIIDGKARLLADNLCDGLGACLGDCPEGAITIIEREAEEFDEEAVSKHLGVPEEPLPIPSAVTVRHNHDHGLGGGCPGARVLQFNPLRDEPLQRIDAPDQPQLSQLRQWPVQLHLVPPTAPYFMNADVLLTADCVAFAMGDFHRSFLKGRALAVACPKLDQGQEIYLEKLVVMIDKALINTLTVMVMEVPCCAGLVQLAIEAARRSSRKVPIKKIVVGLRGDIRSEQWL